MSGEDGYKTPPDDRHDPHIKTNEEVRDHLIGQIENLQADILGDVAGIESAISDVQNKIVELRAKVARIGDATQRLDPIRRD